MSMYTDNGYADRTDYLTSLAEDYDIAIEDVNAIADLLGPNEDFDGLVSSIEDMSSLYY